MFKFLKHTDSLPDSNFGTETASVTELPLTDGSTFKVPLTTIKSIAPHNNAERLEIATVYGFQVVIPKNRFKVGDQVIYIPIDSILPHNVEALVFGNDSKIRLHRGRVRQIRLRGLASQGMIIHPDEVTSIINSTYLKLEQDLKDILGITKYEPPERGPSQTMRKRKGRNKSTDNPAFHSYNGIDNIKWFPDLFQEGEEVVIQEKLHGTNARAGILPFVASTWLKKLKVFLKLAPKLEKCYGSNRVEISSQFGYKGYYGEDVYGSVFKKIDAFSKLKENETVFGEIIGPGIQKGYEYGLKEHIFVLFDVKVYEGPDKVQKWLNPEEVANFAVERGFEFVPVLYTGPFNKAFTESLVSGASVYSSSEKVREGIVIKAKTDYSVEGNKKVLKWINPEYYDDVSNTDNH